MKKKYYNVTVHIPQNLIDIFYAYIWQLPIVGIEEKNTELLICFEEENWNSESAGSFWIDAGTGTGILAILAVKLDAARVLAFDNNE